MKSFGTVLKCCCVDAAIAGAARCPDAASGKRNVAPVRAGKPRAGVYAIQPIVFLALLALPAFGAFPNGYSYCKVVTTQHTMVSGTNDLANYPLTLKLTDADLRTTGNGGLVNNTNGYDIGFYPDCSGSGAALKWEMESYSATTGAIVAHVLRPTLSHTTDDTIGMYYGGSISSFQSTASAVWNAGYQGVWHLASGGLLPESTTNAVTLTNVNAVTSVTGQVDGAAGLAYASAQQLTHADATALRVPNNITVSAWVMATTFRPLGLVVAKCANAGPLQRNYDMDITSTGFVRFYATQGSTQYKGFTANTALTTGTWYYIVAVYDGSFQRIYRNGVPDGTNALTGNVDSALDGPLRIGELQGDTTTYFDGSIDEVRISSVARSADWVLTEYRNQSAPGTYISAGPRIVWGATRVRHVVTGGI
jgi:hypothetical protein